MKKWSNRANDKKGSKRRGGELRKRDVALAIVQGLALTAMISYLFYQSFLAFLALTPLVYITVRRVMRTKRENAQFRLSVQFCDGLQALSAAVRAGYSIENAFSEALSDLRVLYGRQEFIIREFDYICHGVQMNQTLEELLYSCAGRTGLADIQKFAEVFDTAKRTGGDLDGVIEAMEEHVRRRLELQREVMQIIGARKFEQKIMNVVPCCILLYVNVASPEFLAPLYGNAAGVIIMSGCLILYGLGFWLGERTMEMKL